MKKVLIAAIILILLGGIVFVGALAAADFDIDRFSTSATYEKKSKTYTYTGQSIFVDDSDGYIRVVKSEDADIHIEYYESEKDTYRISDDGDIRFVKKSVHKWFDFFGYRNIPVVGMTVALPENYDADLSLSTSNGKVSADNVTAVEIRLATSNGGLELSGLTCDSLFARTSNGEVEAFALRVAGKAELKTSNGGVNINDIVSAEVIAGSSNGSIDARDVEAPKVTLKTSNNGINVQNIKATREIVLKSSNGSIRGNIAGSMADYNITSETSNGRNNLPSDAHLGDIRLNVDTSNGNIDIDFLED